MDRRDLMLTAQIDSEGAEPHLVVHGYNRVKEVQQDLSGNGGRIVPVRRLINKRTGEEVNASYEQASNYFEQWKEDGVQELIPYLNEEKQLEWRDSEEDLETANETVGETAARWADNSWRFVKDWGANIGKSLAKIGTHALKSAVGLAQLTAGNQGVGVGIGGMATPQVRHQAAKGSAQMRQALDRVDEEYLDTTPVGYDAEDKGLMEYSYDLVTGGTNLASQLLIGGAVGAAAGGTSVPYALMVAAESGGETHAAAMANGKGADQAALLGAGDAAVSYALATLDTVGGSISRAAGPAGKNALGKAFLEGLKRPFTSPAEAAKIARRVGWEVVSEMGDTYSHLSFLQGAGVEITQEDKLIASGVAGLYALGASGFMEVGGRIAANSEIKKARKAYAADRLNQANEALQELTPERLKEIEALGEEPITTGQRVNNTEPGGARVVTPRGSVIFADGSEVFADGTIRTPNGVVTNSEGEPITVMPETSDSANVDLFRLIRESDLQVQNIPVDSLKVNDQIVQFKQDADPNTGVVEGERLQGAFNPIPAKPILVMEFADGSREVVTGRHRLDLAKQNNMKAIPANIIYEKDGWTVDAARLMDAYDNILDGKGSDQDFVDFFRNAKLDNRAIQEHPELWSRKRQKDALVVAKGASEDLYTFFMAKDDRLNLETAAAIVSGAPRQKGEQNVKIQRAVLKAVLDNGLRANDAALMTRSLAHAYSQRLEAKGIQQLDLFGEDDTVIMAMGLEAKYAQRKINEINTDLRALKTLLGKQGGNLQARDALLQKYGLESSEDIQGIQNTITKLDGEVNRWKNYFTDPILAKQAQAYAREVLHLENPVIEVDGEITTVDDRIQETAPEVEPTYEDPNQEGFDFAMVNDLGATEAQRQYDEVEARFIRSDGSKDPMVWMRAPNGKPTNLSERQWIHTRTPYFKQRFGDWENDPENATKILDENGEPRVMYHGSPEKFTVFSSKKMGSTGTSRGKGYYFTPSKDFASGYADKGGQLYEVFLDIRKPLAYDHRTMTRAQIYKLIDTLDRKLEAVNGRDMGILMDFGDVHVQGRSNVLNEATDLLDNNESDVDVFAELVNMTNQYDIVANVTYELLGYDGIIPTDTDLEVIALTPNQIKSATDNVGTYSSADDDINYSEMVEGGAQRPLSGRTKPAGTAIPASNSIPLTPKDAGSVLEFANSISQSGKVEAKTFLSQLMKRLGAGDDIEKTKYFALKNGEFSLRLSNHRAVAKTYLEKQNQAKTKLSIVIKLKDTKFRTHKDVHLQELVYFADNLTADVEIGIAKGIANLLTDGNYSGPIPDQINVSPRETLGKTSPSQGDDIIDTVLNTDNQDIKRHDNSSDDINAARGRFDYASTMDISMYGNNGRVPVAGSPARERGVLPLSLHHVVEMYRLLTGKLPRIVANRSHGMATALGWFNNKTQDIMVRAQLFGLVDKTDITVLHDRLVAKGFFKNEDPTWAANHKEKVNKKHNAVEFERVRSEQELAKEVDKLIEQRIKSGIHQGIGTKVMAHELWHLIDLIDGEAVSKCKERGNLLGHLASLKDSFKKVVADISTANDKQITDECLNFIAQWQGSPDTSHFNNNPAEVYAEMGAAMMLDPERVRTNAPQFYEAFLNGITKKPSVMDRWVETMDQMRLGVDGNALVARLQKTWTREAEIAHRQVRDAITKPTLHMKWMDTVRILFDRFKPTIMVVQHAQADVRAKLKADLKAGVILKSDYEAAIARLDKEMVNIRYAKEMFSHQYGRSKLFLIDVNEKVGKIAEKWGVDMQTLNAYMHFKRVSTELQGRATALGVDAPTARKELNAMVQQLGYAQFKRVATLAKVFHALYEQHVLQNPALRQMLGEKRMAYLDKNKHYVTMAHTVDADTVDKVARRLRGEEPSIDPLEVALQDIRSLATGGDRGGIGNVLHRLEGSFRPTVSPLAATAQTAVTLLETAQQNAAIMQVVDALLANNSPDVKILGTGDSRVENARYGTIAFMRDGERITARVPRAVADAINQRNTSIPKFTAAVRILNAAFTTNNFAFAFTAYQRDLDALSINTYGLHRSPLYWLSAYSLGAAIPRKGKLLSTLSYAADVSAYVSAAAQFIPPHIMKSIGENPIGRMIFNRNVSEYWTSYGHKIARIILGGKIEKTLQDAAAARKAGQQTKARELEYCAIMARHVLEDNILLTMNQLRQDDYTKSNLAQLFDKYGLGYDDPSDISPVPRQLFKEIAKGAGKGIWRAATAYWSSAGYVNELASMTNKIAGYCFLHDQQVRGEYDQAHQKEIALQVMDRAGDPNFAARGTIAGMLEMFCSPFWNARREGTMRTLRAAKEHPGNWTAKVLSYAAPRIVSLLISSGLASYYLRKILGDPSEEELEGTTAGEIIHTFDWMQKAYRNVKPYTLENNRVIPFWLSDDGKTTVSLKIPIPEEAKLADMAVIAWWNTHMDAYSPNPERGWSELLKILGQNIAFDPSSTGTLFTTLSSVLSPYVFGSNPYESYRNAPMYSEDEFKARFEKEGYKYLLKSAVKRIWNNSPLLPLYRFMRTDEPEAREDAQTIRDLLAQPVIGPVLMRFASVDSEGLEQTKQQIDNISERQLAVKRLKAKEHFKHFVEGNPHLVPDEILNDWDVVGYMMKYAKEGTEDEQKQMIRSMNRITDPRLQKRALELMQ